MQFGFSTLGDLTWPLDRFADALKLSHYELIEVRGVNDAHIGPDASAEERQRVRHLFESAGIGILSVTGYTSFTDRTRHSEEAAKLRAWLQLASDLGAQYVRVFGGRLLTEQTPEDGLAALAEGLRQVTADAERLGVRIALETHDGFSSAALAGQAASMLASPHVKILWDVHHPLRTGESWEEAYEHLHNHLAYLHIKDAFPMPDGSEQLCLLGAGVLPVADILRKLAKEGPDVPAVVEWEKAWHPELPDCRVAIPQHILKMRSYIQS